MIAEIDRPADNRIQSKSLQQTAGRWSNVGLGLELGSAALGVWNGVWQTPFLFARYGIQCTRGKWERLAPQDLVLKLAFDRQFPLHTEQHGKVLGRRKIFSIRAFSHKFSHLQRWSLTAIPKTNE